MQLLGITTTYYNRLTKVYKNETTPAKIGDKSVQK